jgi:tripeptide aminopeptidase
MAINARADVSEALLTIPQEIARIASLPSVRGAIAWLRNREADFVEWQMAMSRIAAPPFGENARGDWLLERFREFGMTNVHRDESGNVLAFHGEDNRPCVALTAHLDTVFPAGTPLNVKQQGTRLYGPGVSDNGAGLTALLAVASAIRNCAVKPSLPLLFIGNVGEEGEGDLRGMRHIFSTSPYKDLILQTLVLDGAGSDTIVSEALGSRRFEVIVRGPGGHSWSDFGAPNPILVLATAIHEFAQTPIPTSPKTTFNVGIIRGGTSVNSIPESASMRVDIRSTSMVEMERLESALHLALDKAVEKESRATARRGTQRPRHYGLNCEVVPIGNRPAGELDTNARILQVIRAVDAHINNASQIQRASTDANIPLSLGREAIAIGGGGSGGGAHTLQEWFDCTGRELGLKRILLTLLCLAGVTE